MQRGFLTIARSISASLAPTARFAFSNAAKSASTQTTANTKETKTTTVDRLNLTPHEYWITQGQGMERPFTGDVWFEKDVGYYHCTVCSKKLFTWDHKYQSTTGMATFWHHEKNAVKILESAEGVTLSNVNLQGHNSNDAQLEKNRVSCTGCGSHLGLQFFDGPPPTFKRLAINSAAIKFVKKEHWENPHFIHKKRKLQKLTPEQEQARKRSVLQQQQQEQTVSNESQAKNE